MVIFSHILVLGKAIKKRKIILQFNFFFFLQTICMQIYDTYGILGQKCKIQESYNRINTLRL